MGTQTEEKKKYVPSEKVEAYRKAWESLQAPAGYESRYEADMQALYDQIMDTKPFSLDLENNGLYRQYRDQYMKQGRSAMEDTLGRTSALTGGYASSYAQNLGQQAYNEYLQKLNGRLGEIYELEYGRYRDGLTDLKDRYRILQGAEQQDYDRWAEAYDRYLDSEAAARQTYADERQFDYDAWLAMLEYYQNQSQWEAEMALTLDKWKAQQAKTGSRSGSSGSRVTEEKPEKVKRKDWKTEKKKVLL